VITPATTNGSAIRNVVVNWGDGATQDLGAPTGTVTVAHTYRSAGSYTITATATDTSGNVVTVSTSVTVNTTQIGLTITPPSTPPSAGLPAVFTFALGALPPGDFVKDVIVNWGDGSTQNLGAISSTTTVSHVYTTADSYTVRATLNDTAGNTTTVSTSVTVVATSNPTIIITPTVPVGSREVTFQIQVTAPSGVGIVDATIDFGDGVTQSLGGLSGTVTLRHTYTRAGSFPVTVTVKDTLNRTTQGSTSVTVS
jgi:PKD repeat protein